MARKILFICLLWTMCLPAMTMAGEAKVTASVNRDTLSMGETLVLTVDVENTGAEPDVSAIKDFQVQSQGKSSSMQIINASMTRLTQYHFLLLPLKTGRLVIPPIAVDDDGDMLHTQAIAVQVLKENQRSDGDDNFVQARVSAKRVYVGQPFVFTLSFFHRGRIIDAGYQPPDFEGFLIKDLKENSFDAMRNGVRYVVNEVPVILTPVHAGNATIGPGTIQARVEDVSPRSRTQPRGRFFGDPFFNSARSVTIRAASDPVNVKVLPLPPYSGAAFFTGLVGDFDMDISLDKTELGAGESATLTITARGTGNLPDMKTPELVLPEGLKSYEDKPEESVVTGLDGYSGSKIFRFALVPSRAGTFEMEPVSLASFDPASGSYKTFSSGPLTITSEGTGEAPALAAPRTESPVSAEAKQEVEVQGVDILPLKDSLDALEDDRPMPAWLFTLLMLIPPAAFACFLAYRRFGARAETSAQAMARQAREALGAARTAMDGDDDQAFLQNMSHAACRAVLRVSGGQGTAVTLEEAEDVLRRAGKPGLAGEFETLIREVDACRFGGTGLTMERKRAMLERAEALVEEVLS